MSDDDDDDDDDSESSSTNDSRRASNVWPSVVALGGSRGGPASFLSRPSPSLFADTVFVHDHKEFLQDSCALQERFNQDTRRLRAAYCCRNAV